MVWTWWSPGEPEDDLHGFITVKHRDEFERGKPGPFKRVVAITTNSGRCLTT